MSRDMKVSFSRKIIKYKHMRFQVCLSINIKHMACVPYRYNIVLPELTEKWVFKVSKYENSFFLTQSNSFTSLFVSSGKSSNCFLTYAMLYATTFPPLLFTFPTLISTFPTLISTFLNYFFLIPSSVVTNLTEVAGEGGTDCPPQKF